MCATVRAVFDLETAYLGYSLKSAQSLAAARTGTVKRGDIAPVNLGDRVFSLSSLSSPVGSTPFPNPSNSVSEEPAAVPKK